MRLQEDRSDRESEDKLESKELINITVVTDDSTGIWSPGELDFGRTQFCMEWLKVDPENRNKLAQFFYWLAAACQQSQPPFGQQPTSTSEEKAGDMQKSAGENENVKANRC